jgi:hypothetical protein
MTSEDKRDDCAGTNPPARWWEAMTEMRVDQATFCADTRQRMETLEEWKHEQNGDIRRIRDDLSGLREATQKWLVGLLTAIVISLILLVINLIVSLG